MSPDGLWAGSSLAGPSWDDRRFCVSTGFDNALTRAKTIKDGCVMALYAFDIDLILIVTS